MTIWDDVMTQRRERLRRACEFVVYEIGDADPIEAAKAETTLALMQMMEQQPQTG